MQALRKWWQQRAAEERARGAIRRRCTIYCRFGRDFVPGAEIDVEAARGLLLAGGGQPRQPMAEADGVGPGRLVVGA